MYCVFERFLLLVPPSQSPPSPYVTCKVTVFKGEAWSSPSPSIIWFHCSFYESAVLFLIGSPLLSVSVAHRKLGHISRSCELLPVSAHAAAASQQPGIPDLLLIHWAEEQRLMGLFPKSRGLCERSWRVVYVLLASRHKGAPFNNLPLILWLMSKKSIMSDY